MKATLYRRRLAHSLALLALSLFAGCGLRDLALGGGDATETGNARVSGSLHFESGQVAADAEIVILATDYNPILGATIPDSQRVRTDSHGLFQFKNLDSGTYNIQVKHAGTQTVLLITNLTVARSNIIVPKDTLREPGVLSIPIPETQDSGVGYIFLPGTTFKKRIDSEIRIVGKVRMDSVPPCLIPTIAYTKGKAGALSLLIARNFLVPKDKEAQVAPFHDWAYVAKLNLDASASGVPISKDLYGFPMLVRLTSPQFDFSQAQAGGKDLRFAKADGTPLIREIEVWDALGGRAEVWVRMDTVHAGAITQSLTMHWGNINANAPKFPFQVFDTSNGFSGVWHLGEERQDTVANGLYLDATGSGNNGNDRIASTSVSGVIAGGHGFDSADYIEAPMLPGSASISNTFTISIWFRTLSPISSNGSELLSMGDNYGLRLFGGDQLRVFFYPATPPPGPGAEWYEVNFKKPELIDGHWHLAAGTFDESYLHLYLDGQEVSKIPALGPLGYFFPLNATMGKHGHLKPDFAFVGDLDEAQIHAVARSQDWMLLSFENQKPGATFPTIVLP